MNYALAAVMMAACASAMEVPHIPRAVPHIPKATAPNCALPYNQITIPAGGSYTVTQTGAPNNDKMLCGWKFTSSDGSKLNVDCSSFSLRGTREELLVVEKDGTTSDVTRFTSTSGPSDRDLATDEAVVAYRYKSGQQGSFTCTVSTQSSSSSNTDSGSSSSGTDSSSTDSKSCRCGIVNRASGRIVGGVATEVNEYPWQVGFRWAGTSSVFCGGTLISDRYILTAAHCIDTLDTSDFDLMLGGHSTRNEAPSTIIVEPLQIIKHSGYNSNTMDNDIALIRIAPLDFTDSDVEVRPVCLPDSNDQYVGSQATVSGWGTLSSGGDQPLALREVTVPVVSNSECNSAYGGITSNMLCAGTAGKDSCQGDSGGPLVTPDGENYELIGVVSYGYGCADAGYPGVYARVTQYLDWIEQNTPSDSTCSR